MNYVGIRINLKIWENCYIIITSSKASEMFLVLKCIRAPPRAELVHRLGDIELGGIINKGSGITGTGGPLRYFRTDRGTPRLACAPLFGRDHLERAVMPRPRLDSFLLAAKETPTRAATRGGLFHVPRSGSNDSSHVPSTCRGRQAVLSATLVIPSEPRPLCSPQRHVVFAPFRFTGWSVRLE